MFACSIVNLPRWHLNTRSWKILEPDLTILPGKCWKTCWNVLYQRWVTNSPIWLGLCGGLDQSASWCATWWETPLGTDRIVDQVPTRWTLLDFAPFSTNISVSCSGVVPSWGQRPLQIMAWHQSLAVLLTHCGQSIFRKNTRLDATRCQISRLTTTTSV